MAKQSYLAAAGAATQLEQAAPEQVRNNAGGYVFDVGPMEALKRFLILGSEGGTYYAGERDLTRENLANTKACLTANGEEAVKLIRDISYSGRAPKNDPALYALALAASSPTQRTRQAALAALPSVARTGTHLFQFVEYVTAMRGWGETLKRGVADWYTRKTMDSLVYQILKYQRRGNWSHKDVVCCAHPKVTGPMNDIFNYVVKGVVPHHPMIEAFEEIKATTHEKRVIASIEQYRLTREMVPTEHLKSPAVWEALLHQPMPLTAMVRNLGVMTANGLIAPLSTAARYVANSLADAEALKRQRVHPIQLLTALNTYERGRGLKGSLTWTPNAMVLEALEAAFYAAFDNVSPTGLRYYIAIDVSGSMSMGTVAGSPGLTPAKGASAMAMLVARTEPQHFIGGFSNQFIELPINAKTSLRDAQRAVQMPFGATDTSVAIRHAMDRKIPVDVFVTITDNETWSGDRHTYETLEEYRRSTGIPARLVVIAMTATRFSIGAGHDPGSLDVVGFDTSVPKAIAEFAGADTSKTSGTDES